MTDLPDTLQQLRQSDERNRRIIEGVRDHAIFVTDATGTIVDWTPGAAAIFGWPAEEIVGQPSDLLFTPEDRAAGVPAQELEAARSHGCANDERWHIRRDGSRLFANGSVRPLHDGDGQVTGFIKIARDETRRRTADAALRESEARLRALTDNLPSGMVYQIATGPDGQDRRFLFVSRSHERLTGVSADAVLADPSIPYNLILPKFREQVAAAEAQAIRDRTPFDVEVQIRRTDGEARWCRIISAPRVQDDGSLIWDGIQIDVTDHKLAADALRESDARFQAVVNSIDQMVWSTRADGFHDFFNQRWYEFTGVRPGSTDGEGWNDIFHPDDQERAWGSWRHSLDTGETYRIEYRLRHHSGTYRWVLGRAQPVRDGGGRITRWFGTCTDIDDIVSAREVLARAGEDLERQVAERTKERDRLWTLSEDMLARADYDGNLSGVNPAWTRTLGWTERKLLTEPYAGIIHPDDLDSSLAALATMRTTGSPSRFENRIRTASGEWKPVGWIVSPEPDGRNFIAVGRDLTEDKARERELVHAQEALRQSQKMEAMGQLTGGVAHDFNNLLTPIIGSLDMLQRREIGGQREQRLIRGALESADRAKTLVQRLLAFARRQPLKPAAIDIAALLEGMGELVASTTGPQIRIMIEVPDDLIPAVADPNQLEMAILNLSVNARDAMRDGGTLTLAAQADHVAPGHRSGLRQGDYVLVSVADTGTGMDAATRKRAVEPFFSTKGVGKGTGLGLSMVHGLASQLGGAMTIASEPGLGTKIELWLPASTEPAGRAAEALADSPVAQGAGTVLLVDDEETVRSSTADMLADLGYRVIEAATAGEALALLEGGLHFDLLLTDHLMPGMTGTDLAREVRMRWPNCPILLISGFAEVEGAAPDLPRLTKPFRQSELAAALQTLT